MIQPLATALSFLTVLRLPGASSRTLSSEDLAASFSFFPLVGFLLGAIVTALSYPFLSVAPPLLLATWMDWRTWPTAWAEDTLPSAGWKS